MEFWGVEVKAGVPLKVHPDYQEAVIHLSQATLGESKKEKGNESVVLSLKIDGKKIVLGHLSTEKTPQLSFDLVFEKEVELSHNSKNSVFFCGYQSLPQEDEYTDASDSSDEDEPIQLANAENDDMKVLPPLAPVASKSDSAKPDSSSKQKSKPLLPVKDNKAENESDDEDSEDESEDDDDDESEDGGSEEGMSVDGDSDAEDDSESEDEETPKKAGKAGTKRPNNSASKTPVPTKKQKAATPQKTDGKKSAHTATPHPAKKVAAKTSANGSDTKPQTPKSGGKFSCGSCDRLPPNRAFGSDTALQAHSKAKHSAK
ncbi:histone deacetylase HDT1 isoform X3 [Euphorbia lathyris]|uniref:histone deacetylase HDT1 isoform X3 n=1 Tax=Euphorbia lathyris TaxID=212925 RepID=UPI0033134D0C